MNEKHVIKIPTPNPPMDLMPQEPMGDEMGPESMDLMPQEPMDDEMGQESMIGGEENADDPKKNIQRLAGELSQALRTYNQEQEQIDTDLNKYVIGMIASQAAKNMTPQEKNEVIKKIEKGSDINNERENIDTEESNLPMEECTQNSVMSDKGDKRYNKKAPKTFNPFIANR